MLFYDGESLLMELPVLGSALPLLRSFLVLSGFGGEPECPVTDLKKYFTPVVPVVHSPLKWTYQCIYRS